MPNFRLSRSFALIFILSLLGIIDMSYLTETRLRGAALVCGAISNISKCNVVATSSYSAIYGIPVALLGLLFYIAVALGAAYYSRGKNRLILRWLLIFAGAGLIFSFYLLYVQIFVLRALCQYCLASDLLTALILVILIVLYKRDRARFSTDNGKVKVI